MSDSSSSAHWHNGPTFGIEIECLGVFEHDELGGTDWNLLSNPNIHGEEPVDVVASALNTFIAESDLIPGHTELTKIDPYGRPEAAEDLRTGDYSSWTVTTDPSVKATWEHQNETLERGTFTQLRNTGSHQLSKYLSDLTGPVPEPERSRLGFRGVEIVSPVLPATNAGFEAVRKLYSFLDENSFVVNQRCGLHVHVANRKYMSPESKITYPALMKLIRWAVCAEYQLCQLVPAHRVLEAGSYNNLLSRRLNNKATVRDCYEQIGKYGHKHELILDFGDKRCTIKISNLNKEIDEHVEPSIPSSESGDNPEPDADDNGTADTTVWPAHDPDSQALEYSWWNQTVFWNQTTSGSEDHTELEVAPEEEPEVEPQEQEKRHLSATIEFRLGEATIDPDRAVNWVKFVTSFMRVVQSDDNQSWDFLQIYNEHTSVKEMLTDIGLAEFIGKLPVFPHTFSAYKNFKES